MPVLSISTDWSIQSISIKSILKIYTNLWIEILALIFIGWLRREIEHSWNVPCLCRYSAAFWAPGEPNTDYHDEYEICIALKSTGDLADWIDADCYEPKGYICKIEGE